MPFYFTAQQKQVLADLLGNRNPLDAGVKFDDIYRKIVEFIDASTDPSVLQDAEVQGVELFLRGAAQINAGIGNFSQIVRTYTQRQLELRSSDAFTPEEMQMSLQRASNAIAFAIVTDVLGLDADNPNLDAKLPSSKDIAKFDAGNAVARFFAPHILDETDTAREVDVAASRTSAGSGASIKGQPTVSSARIPASTKCRSVVSA